MNKYIINYYFDGTGHVEITAKNKTEAREKFYIGDYDFNPNNELADTYEIETIEKVESK